MEKTVLHVSIMFLMYVFCSFTFANDKGSGEQYWQCGASGKYFQQKSVKAPAAFYKGTNSIYAKIDNKWHKYKLVKLPKRFLRWDWNARLQTIANMQQNVFPAGNIDASHNAIVATYGSLRADDEIKVNNAIKGMGFLPKSDRIDSLLRMLKMTMHDDPAKKLKLLQKIYQKADLLFDSTKLISLELYSTPVRCTKTFINQMHTPISSIIFFANPCYQIKTIAYLLHPDNPNLTAHEKKVVEYVNLMHQYFHKSTAKFPAVIYNVVEVYDSTPMHETNNVGRKIAPKEHF